MNVGFEDRNIKVGESFVLIFVRVKRVIAERESRKGITFNFIRTLLRFFQVKKLFEFLMNIEYWSGLVS
jgi:hypothetical protein